MASNQLRPHQVRACLLAGLNPEMVPGPGPKILDDYCNDLAERHSGSDADPVARLATQFLKEACGDHWPDEFAARLRRASRDLQAIADAVDREVSINNS